MSEKLEHSLKEGAHYQLARLEGKWKGTTKVWFEPNVLSDESATEGEIEQILNGMFIQHIYKGSIEGKPLQGMMIIGYSLQFGRYHCAWIDSFHNGTNTMYSEQDGTSGLSFTGKYGSDNPSEQWGWRTEISHPSEDELIITMFNITPEGEEAKAVETVYKRVL